MIAVLWCSMEFDYGVVLCGNVVLSCWICVLIMLLLKIKVEFCVELRGF